jgi:hypothetical protein
MDKPIKVTEIIKYLPLLMSKGKGRALAGKQQRKGKESANIDEVEDKG